MRASSHSVVIAIVLVVIVPLAGCGGSLLEDGESTPDPTANGTDGTERGDPTQTETEDEESEDGATSPPDDENVSATFLAPDGNATVTLEVAATPEERHRGLMRRESLPENHGMVFVYPGAAERSFWMKDTPLPLDIIFVAPNGTVLNVENADPQPNASNAELERYRSAGAAQYVVELEQGFADRTGVEAGTRVVFHDDLEARTEGADRSRGADGGSRQIVRP